MKKVLSLIVALVMVLSMVPTVFAASTGTLVLGDNAIALASGDADGETATFVATEAGELTITVTAMSAYDSYNEAMEAVPATAIGFQLATKYPFVVNNEQVYDKTKTVSVAAGDTVTVVISSSMRNMAEFTVNLSFAPQSGGSGQAAPGTQENPLVIDALPFGLQMTGSECFDRYYTYTAEKTGTIVMTCPVGAYITTDYPYEIEETSTTTTYYIEVAQNETISLNPWYLDPSLTGEFTFAYADTGSDDTTTGETTTEEPAGDGSVPDGDMDDVLVVEETNLQVTANGTQINYTPDVNGTMTVVISGDPGYRIYVADSRGESVGLPAEGSTQREITYDGMVAGETYTITVYGFSTDSWETANAAVSYKITYGTSSAQTEPWVDAGGVGLGVNDVVLAPNAEYSLFTFTPAEEGVYKITASGNVTMEKWLNSTYSKEKDATDGVLEVTITAVGQTALLALTGDTASATVTVEKTGTYTPPAATVYTDYVNVHTPVKGTAPAGQVVKIDISAAQTVALGADGFYHYGSPTGPVVYIDLETEEFSLSAAYGSYGAIAMNGSYDGASYNFLSAMKKYNAATDSNGLYPLTEDLAIFMRAYGAAQGWYTAGMSPFAAINDGAFNADSAWLVLSSYAAVSGTEGDSASGSGVPEDSTSDSAAGTTDGAASGTYKTGDAADLPLLVGLMILSGAAMAALLITGKKRTV